MTTDYHDFTHINMSPEERIKMDVGDWYTNQIKCLNCGWYIRSKNRHDFVYCKCKEVAVDGGSWYLKRIGNLKNYEELSVGYTYPHV